MNQQPSVSHLRDILIYLREGSQRLDTEIGRGDRYLACTTCALALAILSAQG